MRLLVVILGSVLVACGTPAGVTSSEVPPEPSVGSTTATAPSAVPADYPRCEQDPPLGSGSGLYAVCPLASPTNPDTNPRNLVLFDESDTPETALAAWFAAAPTSPHDLQFPDVGPADLVTTSLTNGQLNVTLSNDLVGRNNLSTSASFGGLLAGIYATALSFDNVDSVQISMEDPSVNFCALGDAVSDCTPITRADAVATFLTVAST